MGLLTFESYTKYDFKISTIKNFKPDFRLSLINVWTFFSVIHDRLPDCYIVDTTSLQHTDPL